MNTEQIDGRWLALLLVARRAAVGADQDCVVFAGMARIKPEGGYLLDRGPDYKKIDLREEWLGRLQAVPPERRRLVHNADFVLPLVVDALPGNEDLEQYVQDRFGTETSGCS